MAKHSLLAGLLVAVGFIVPLAPAVADREGCGPGWSLFQDYESNPQHQKRLHDALNVKPEQEGAWKKYLESLQAAKPAERPRTDWASLAAPERVDQILEAARRNQEYMARQVEAMKAFYSILTPEQKKTFDDFHGGPRGGKRG